jgi:hypothetical protein
LLKMVQGRHLVWEQGFVWHTLLIIGLP